MEFKYQLYTNNSEYKHNQFLISDGERPFHPSRVSRLIQISQLSGDIKAKNSVLLMSNVLRFQLSIK